MLLMNIRQVKPDGGDYSLSVPLSILPGLNADFDGDLPKVFYRELGKKHLFMSMSPETSLTAGISC